MAKKSASLSFRDIVLGAEADVIRQAHEARVQIDQLVEERQRAYALIAELETKVEDVLGESGVFPFPAPPLPVAGFDPKADTVTRGAPAAKKAGTRPASSASTEDTETPETDDDATPTA
jgi:hypothetical protein